MTWPRILPKKVMDLKRSGWTKRHVIAWFLLLNFLSCLSVRMMWGGKLEVKADTEPGQARIWLMAGITSQPEAAFRLIEFNGEYEACYLAYSPMGFNPKNASGQLQELVQDGDVVCGVSVGAKPIEYAGIASRCQSILINPCCNPRALKTPLYHVMKIGAPVLEVISYGIGWVAVLPIIPADLGTHTSIATVVDQLFWIAYGEPETKDYAQYGVVLSLRDEFLNNDWLRQTYVEAEIAEIDTQHGFIGDEEQAGAYGYGINQLLH